MALLLDEAKDKMVVMILPLNELEADQVSILIYGKKVVSLTLYKAERFHKLGLMATAVNANVYNQ